MSEYIKIGDIATITIKAKVQCLPATDGCDGCVFFDGNIDCFQAQEPPACIEETRSDGKNVIFKLVEEE